MFWNVTESEECAQPTDPVGAPWSIFIFEVHTRKYEEPCMKENGSTIIFINPRATGNFTQVV